MVWPWKSRLNQCVRWGGFHLPNGKLSKRQLSDGLHLLGLIKHWDSWNVASTPVHTYEQIKCVQAHTDMHTHKDQAHFKLLHRKHNNRTRTHTKKVQQTVTRETRFASCMKTSISILMSVSELHTEHSALTMSIDTEFGQDQINTFKIRDYSELIGDKNTWRLFKSSNSV